MDWAKLIDRLSQIHVRGQSWRQTRHVAQMWFSSWGQPHFGLLEIHKMSPAPSSGSHRSSILISINGDFFWDQPLQVSRFQHGSIVPAVWTKNLGIKLTAVRFDLVWLICVQENRIELLTCPAFQSAPKAAVRGGAGKAQIASPPHLDQTQHVWRNTGMNLTTSLNVKWS